MTFKKLTAAQFVALQPNPEIGAKIEAKAREVEGLKAIDRMKDRAGLSLVDLPPLPSNLERMLARTLEDVSRDAEQVVWAHRPANMPPWRSRSSLITSERG